MLQMALDARRAEESLALADAGRRDTEIKMKDLQTRLATAEAEAMRNGGRKQLSALQQKVFS